MLLVLIKLMCFYNLQQKVAGEYKCSHEDGGQGRTGVNPQTHRRRQEITNPGTDPKFFTVLHPHSCNP